MKILVTGAKGMLGTDLVPILKEKNHDVFETDIEELNICKIDKLYEMAEDTSPDIIVNCAAYTQVDKAEEEVNEAFLINGIGVQNLALVCRDFNIDLCHISTDYVFDGEKKGPYSPFDAANPMNVYGLSKLAGEKFIQWIWNRFYIIRTSWLYGKNGKNFVYTTLKLAENQKELRIVDDQIGSPTWTVTLSQAISKLIETKKHGIYHVTDEIKNGISWYQFAQEIIKLSGYKLKVIHVKSEEFEQPAKRPRNSVLDLTMTKLVLEEDLPSWKKSLEKFLTEIAFNQKDEK